jgi:hypothetical protein
MVLMLNKLVITLKIYNQTYINKILKRHAWINEPQHQNIDDYPIPMISDSTYQQNLETAEALPQKQLNKIEKEYGFGY